jgi:DNA sulfur modification protein DndC
MEVRHRGLAAVLDIQEEINATAVREGRPTISLINAEERARIDALIQGNTWPQKWTGEES